MHKFGLILLVALIGCGGGGSADSSVNVLFPFSGAVTDAAAITVRGNTSGATAVTVNGLAARSGDGFRTWSVNVPLVRGSNQLLVEVSDDSGPIANESIVVERQEVLIGTSDIAFDAANSRLLVVQELAEAVPALVGIDIRTGVAAVVSGPGVGSGPAIDQLAAVAVDAAGNRAFVFDFNLGDLLAVDLANGNRTLISGSTRGTGDDFGYIGSLGIDASRNRALAIDGSRMIAIDLSSGNRSEFTDELDRPRSLAIDAAGDRVIVLDGTSVIAADLGTSILSVLSNDTTGTGPELTQANYIAFDATRNTALVTGYRDTVFQVDLATGSRSVLSDGSNGAGPQLQSAHEIVVDAARSRALVSDKNDGYDAIIAVDLSSGNRSTLFASARGTGPFIDDPRDVTLDAARGRLLVADPGSDGDHILAVDIRSGDRTVLAAYPTGNPEGIAIDEARDRVLLSDTTDNALYAMDPVTGARTVIADATRGSGPNLDSPQDLAVDAARNRALIADSGLVAIVAVDLTTGNRTIIADDTVGTGPALESPQDIELDSANNRVLVVDRGLEALVAVDVATGNRSIVSDSDVGSGPSFVGNEGFTLDRQRNRALIVERRMVLAVDLTSGDRTVLADLTIGAGPKLGNTLEDIVILPGDIGIILDDSSPNYLFAIDLVTGERCIFAK